MRIKNGYILREIGDMAIIVAVGKESLKFNGMISINPTGAFIWRMLEKGTSEEEILKEILLKYEIDEVSAKRSITYFINRLKEADLLDE